MPASLRHIPLNANESSMWTNSTRDSGARIRLLFLLVLQCTLGCSGGAAPTVGDSESRPSKTNPLASLSTEELVQRIDLDPEVPHGQYTPAVRTLIARGPIVLPVLLNHMLHDDEVTRDRTLTAIAGVLVAYFHEQPQYKGDFTEAHRAWVRFMKEHGDLQYNQPVEARKSAVNSLLEWYKATFDKK